MVCRFHPGGPRLVSSRQIRCAACSLAPPEDFWAAPRSLASKKNTAVFYFFTGLCLPRWREEAAVFIPLDLSTPPHVVSNIRAPRGTHVFWWSTPVNCRRMRSKGGETHGLHVMVAIAEIAGLKSPGSRGCYGELQRACFDAGRSPRNPRRSGPPRHPPSNAAYNFCGRAPTAIVRTSSSPSVSRWTGYRQAGWG